MAYDPNNLASTPVGYQTPEQIKQLYEYSNQLTQGGMRDAPITSPWQGVRMLADALSGNYLRNKTGQQQQHAWDVGSQNRVAPPIPSYTPFQNVPPGTPGTGTTASAIGLPQYNVLPGMSAPGGSNMMTALMTPPPG